MNPKQDENPADQENPAPVEETDGDSAGGDTSTGSDSETDTGAGEDAGTGDAGAGPPDSAQDVASLPSWAQDLLRKTREEAAKARTGAKQKILDQAAAERAKAVEDAKTSMAEAVAKAIGLKPEGEEELTPEQVLEKISAERDEERKAREARDEKYRELLVEVAVQDAANMHDADAAKLLDSRSFLRALKDLDVDDASYRTAVAAAVEKAVADSPGFRTETKPRPPAVSGGTAPTGVKGKTPDDMTIDELRKAGLHRRS